MTLNILSGQGTGNDNFFKALFRTKGFYYTKFMRKYDDLTLQELDYVLDLAKEDIAVNQKVNGRYLYFNLYRQNYMHMSRIDAYHVRILGPIIGKLSVTIQDMGKEHYNVFYVFQQRQVISHSSRVKNAKSAAHRPYLSYAMSDPNLRKARYRVQGRIWKHGNNKRTRQEDIKDDGTETGLD